MDDAKIIEAAFLEVQKDENYCFGGRGLTDNPDMETKKFIIEMYQKFTGRDVIKEITEIEN